MSFSFFLRFVFVPGVRVSAARAAGVRVGMMLAVRRAGLALQLIAEQPVFICLPFELFRSRQRVFYALDDLLVEIFNTAKGATS